ncbi:MAG: hypothetical protein HYY55_03580 [Candidatus Niyogibacteria bacterium]|nr:MAG: hypothetical protein HYY55_03580 [Candidatus Niyogibacteria bacterium]
MKRKLILYASIFGIVIAFDGLKYLAVDGPNIINWQSFAHPAWVIFTLALFAYAATSYSQPVFKSAFFVHTAVFAAAFLNQYLPFSETLTYNCMLFNLVFLSMYYLLFSYKERK